MTESIDVLEGLHALRLPTPVGEAALADAALGLSLGLLAALALSRIARLVARRRAPLRAAMLEELARTRALPPAERLLAQTRLLRRLAARRSFMRGRTRDGRHWLDALAGRAFFRRGPGAALREDLYRPEPAIDPELLDREIARMLRWARL